MRAIGRGGMATVYLAIQESFQRQVALKIMSSELAKEQDFSERFLREARIVSQLVHPNIVTVHDVGIQNEHHYLSMQFIDGEDLKQRLPEMSAEQIFRVLREVAQALDYAGNKGYVHRDVKPENIMLNNDDGRAILMDFGIARASRPDNSMTRTGIAVGTPHYMSPEQARGMEVDGRSDLYSLGVVFYYALTGCVPYEADSPVAVGIKHLTEPVPTLPAPLACYQPVLNKLMAKKPEQRYQRGNELVEALLQLPTRPLQQWHEREGFEFHGDGLDTPVRSTVTLEADAVTAVAPAAKTRQQPQPGPRRARTASRLDLIDEEGIHIPEEDLVARARPQQQRSAWPLILLVLIAIGVGIGYYLYPQQARQQLDKGLAYVEQLTGQSSSTGMSGQEQGKVLEGGDDESADQYLSERPAVPASEQRTLLPSSGSTTGGVQAMWQQAEALAAQVKEQPERRGNLINAYRDILAIDADHAAAQAALAKQKTAVLTQVRTLLTEENLPAARSLLATAVGWFPELQGAAEYTELQQVLAESEQIQALLQTAGQLLSDNKLLKPAGENAVETFRQVLQLDADNQAAKAGLREVVKRYQQLVLSQQRKGAYSKALTLVASGLSIEPDDRALLTLRDELQQQQQTQQSVQQLLAEAQTLAQQERLFNPADGAVTRYLQVLQLEPGHSEARQALSVLLQQRYQQIEQQLAARQLTQATELVEQALEVVPRDERLLALLLEIEASKPAIDALVLSGSEISSVSQPARTTISADRMLYIAFRYKNLDKPTTVFQATLYDGSRSLQIAAVPVVVRGEQGEARFRIERPVEGFTEGGYHIDIALAGRRIFTQAFAIAR